MAPKDGERSAASATRFTATTPHASSKTPLKIRKVGSTQSSSQSFQVEPDVEDPKSEFRRPFPQAKTETPAERVARLRAAHEVAKNARVSSVDRFLEKTRPILNSAHKITVIGLVSLTGVFLFPPYCPIFVATRIGRQARHGVPIT